MNYINLIARLITEDPDVIDESRFDREITRSQAMQKYKQYETQFKPLFSDGNLGYRYSFPNGWGLSIMANYEDDDQWMLALWNDGKRIEHNNMQRIIYIIDPKLNIHDERRAFREASLLVWPCEVETIASGIQAFPDAATMTANQHYNHRKMNN